ncbi:G patch domain-containing protein 8-like [Triticum urartu]|uniref:G patch domain-containing protein 8-like n=1 Tax=Triticum urartu TaxID=4572 RepID=UPI002043B7A4|nr:G patch domain-containing protein 8-like [Triticum urartu]XP_048559489.1 G patch domain-containing protein 8-like [Triticum urartu]
MYLKKCQRDMTPWCVCGDCKIPASFGTQRPMKYTSTHDKLDNIKISVFTLDQIFDLLESLQNDPGQDETDEGKRLLVTLFLLLGEGPRFAQLQQFFITYSGSEIVRELDPYICDQFRRWAKLCRICFKYHLAELEKPLYDAFAAANNLSDDEGAEDDTNPYRSIDGMITEMAVETAKVECKLNYTNLCGGEILLLNSDISLCLDILMRIDGYTGKLHNKKQSDESYLWLEEGEERQCKVAVLPAPPQDGEMTESVLPPPPQDGEMTESVLPPPQDGEMTESVLPPLPQDGEMDESEANGTDKPETNKKKAAKAKAEDQARAAARAAAKRMPQVQRSEEYRMLKKKEKKKKKERKRLGLCDAAEYDANEVGSSADSQEEDADICPYAGAEGLSGEGKEEKTGGAADERMWDHSKNRGEEGASGSPSVCTQVEDVGAVVSYGEGKQEKTGGSSGKRNGRQGKIEGKDNDADSPYVEALVTQQPKNVGSASFCDDSVSKQRKNKEEENSCPVAVQLPPEEGDQELKQHGASRPSSNSPGNRRHRRRGNSKKGEDGSALSPIEAHVPSENWKQNKSNSPGNRRHRRRGNSKEVHDSALSPDEAHAPSEKGKQNKKWNSRGNRRHKHGGNFEEYDSALSPDKAHVPSEKGKQKKLNSPGNRKRLNSPGNRRTNSPGNRKKAEYDSDESTVEPQVASQKGKCKKKPKPKPKR